MVWGCATYDCKPDLTTIPGTLNAQKTREDVIEPSVVSQFDYNTLTNRPN